MPDPNQTDPNNSTSGVSPTPVSTSDPISPVVPSIDPVVESSPVQQPVDVPPAFLPQDDAPPIPDFQAVTTEVPTVAPTVLEPSVLPAEAPADTGSAAPLDAFAPNITSPKKKFGGGRVIATILGLFVLIGGVGAGILLTQQQQLFQQKAAGACPSNGQTRCGGQGIEICIGGSWANGGSCSNGCSNGKCNAGVSCTGNQTSCGGQCVNTSADSNHCGGCNNKCDAGSSCKSGDCKADAPADPNVCSINGQLRCSGNTSQVCAGGSWQTNKVCPVGCEGAGICKAETCATNGQLRCTFNTSQVCVGGSWQTNKVCSNVDGCNTTSGNCNPPSTGGGTDGGACQAGTAPYTCDANGCRITSGYPTNYVNHWVCNTRKPEGCSDILLEQAVQSASFSRNCGTEQIDVKAVGYGTQCSTNGNKPYADVRSKTYATDCVATPPSGRTGPTAQCQNVKAYSSTWEPLTSAQLSALTTGANINFCVTGIATTGNFDRARFTINGAAQAETTTKRPGSEDFCQNYTIPAGVTTFNISAQIHHVTLGYK